MLKTISLVAAVAATLLMLSPADAQRGGGPGAPAAAPRPVAVAAVVLPAAAVVAVVAPVVAAVAPA